MTRCEGGRKREREYGGKKDERGKGMREEGLEGGSSGGHIR